jgi:AcrR family transcriptional regulator
MATWSDERSEFANIQRIIEDRLVLMRPSEVLLPAPGRGQYDRRLPRQQRLAEQRDRLIAATSLVAAREAAPSVASIVECAGVGRNTFYEYFDDVPHALDAAEGVVLRRLEQVLRDAEAASRTPVERWRALARAWLSFAEREPAAMLLTLRIDARGEGASSRGASVLDAALVRSLETLRSAGVTAPLAGAERVLAVAAVGEAFARGLARAQIVAKEPETSGPRISNDAWERDRLERSLADVAVRLLR